MFRRADASQTPLAACQQSMTCTLAVAKRGAFQVFGKMDTTVANVELYSAALKCWPNRPSVFTGPAHTQGDEES